MGAAAGRVCAETRLKSPCSSRGFRVGGQADTVNNPTTCFGPQSHLSAAPGPRGTAAAAAGASDTCWPLPSLPD